jgi:hypothetical protein
MKDLNEVLRQKEQQVQQLQEEIGVLRMAARLLADGENRANITASAPAVPPLHEAAMTMGPIKQTKAGRPLTTYDKTPAQFP